MSKTTLTLNARLDRGDFALDVWLALPGHGITALFGPSGSGKTTCLRVLAGLERQATGAVVVDGQTWQDSARGVFLPTHQRALGYVFQEASLFDHLTVEGNLRFGFDRTPAAQRRHDWRHGLELLGIGHLLQRRPHELSGGERQRVAIARALATSPQLLLMDEPLAALDTARKAEILPWLEQLHEALDVPVVYVTHSLDEVARLADHVVLLEEGRVLADGPLAQMLTRSNLPLARGDSAVSVLQGHCSGYSPADQLAVYDIDGGQLLLPQSRQGVPQPGTRARLHIQARDVSLSLVMPAQTSVLNVLPAVVDSLTDNAPAQVVVSLRLGADGQGATLLSRISSLSARRLALAPGQLVYAQIKGVAMVR
ncbi:molybdenum ABC transporter ATP-binding protein [Hydrogenophaga pseudoflava]|jgi:molybdate transport system ATP-binding protein|uniref:molybdenum ABC transporter ATP-binding protein n=1 Tax=Hydrogenophaga pseudoflava TaxID=47421 RepID=UPI000824674B|nr:molybdenum ABC transporter ATP-binding protein [Hydrogenophaga pseudoflava]